MSEGIGARLRGARERRRLTILQAAERLHVDPYIPEALEAENFAALGAPVYVKGHLRHYAELVGEPAADLLDMYTHSTRIVAPDLTRIPKAPPDDAGRLVAPAVVVVIVFAVAGTAWWGLTLWDHQWGPHPVAVPVRAAVLAGATASPPRAAGAVPAAAAATAKVSLPPRKAGAATAAAAPHGEIDATLRYSGDSWTEVDDATGRRLLYGLSTGPATRELEGVPPLSVTLGDASDVTIEVGGREASISRFVRSDHTARFRIDGDGRVLPPPPKKGG